MAKQTEAQVLKQATRLLTNISFAIDAAFEVSESYPEADKAYVQEVLAGLRKDLADALPQTVDGKTTITLPVTATSDGVF